MAKEAHRFTGRAPSMYESSPGAKRYFCANCGIAPFSEATMPNGAEMAAINLRCVPEIDIATLTVTQYDGASR